MVASRSLHNALTTAGTGGRPQPPNLVFVFSDQQSYDMVGCCGNRGVITPNLDRFATQGVRFTHCVANAPVCTPNRGILLSGQHPLRHGAIDNDVRMLPGDGHYFAEVLRDAGYRLGYYGKWHLYGGNRYRPVPPGPFRYGFDHEYLTNNCTLLYNAEDAFFWNDDGEKALYGDWEPYAQTRQAMEFVTRHRDRPFALFLSWHPPHNWGSAKLGYGYEAPADLMALYDRQAIRLRGNCADTPAARKDYHGYMAMCTGIDRAFGWLMDELHRQGLDNNTIVVFSSDHGDFLLSHDYTGNKARPEQESVRVPLMIRYPGRLRPRVSDLLVGWLDLMPTLLGLMGIPAPATCDGLNLTNAMMTENDNATASVPLFLHSLDFLGVYTRRHTYCYDTSGGTVSMSRRFAYSTPANCPWNCLYDRERDPWELRNLFDDTSCRPLREELHGLTQQWMATFGDPGVSFSEILKAAFDPADVLPDGTRTMRNFTGILRGCPRDLLQQR